MVQSVFAFFSSERGLFQESASSLDDQAKEAIRSKGGRPEEMKMIHVFTLFSVCGKKNRKDVYKFLLGLNQRYSFRYLAC
jgi:hypothetical protein